MRTLKFVDVGCETNPVRRQNEFFDRVGLPISMPDHLRMPHHGSFVHPSSPGGLKEAIDLRYVDFGFGHIFIYRGQSFPEVSQVILILGFASMLEHSAISNH